MHFGKTAIFSIKLWRKLPNYIQDYNFLSLQQWNTICQKSFTMSMDAENDSTPLELTLETLKKNEPWTTNISTLFRSNPNEKSNQVSIAGDGVKGVERARARVRELTPLIFQVRTPLLSLYFYCFPPYVFLGLYNIQYLHLH